MGNTQTHLPVENSRVVFFLFYLLFSILISILCYPYLLSSLQIVYKVVQCPFDKSYSGWYRYRGERANKSLYLDENGNAMIDWEPHLLQGTPKLGLRLNFDKTIIFGLLLHGALEKQGVIFYPDGDILLVNNSQGGIILGDAKLWNKKNFLEILSYSYGTIINRFLVSHNALYFDISSDSSSIADATSEALPTQAHSCYADSETHILDNTIDYSRREEEKDTSDTLNNNWTNIPPPSQTESIQSARSVVTQRPIPVPVHRIYSRSSDGTKSNNTYYCHSADPCKTSFFSDHIHGTRLLPLVTNLFLVGHIYHDSSHPSSSHPSIFGTTHATSSKEFTRIVPKNPLQKILRKKKYLIGFSPDQEGKLFLMEKLHSGPKQSSKGVECPPCLEEAPYKYSCDGVGVVGDEYYTLSPLEELAGSSEALISILFNLQLHKDLDPFYEYEHSISHTIHYLLEKTNRGNQVNKKMSIHERIYYLLRISELVLFFHEKKIALTSKILNTHELFIDAKNQEIYIPRLVSLLLERESSQSEAGEKRGEFFSPSHDDKIQSVLAHIKGISLGKGFGEDLLKYDREGVHMLRGFETPVAFEDLVRYCPPEVLLGGKCDLEGDIWSLGCLLWELLSEKIAFGGLTCYQIWFGVGMGGMTLPLEGLPQMVRCLLSRCFRWDKQERCEIGEFLEGVRDMHQLYVQEAEGHLADLLGC